MKIWSGVSIIRHFAICKRAFDWIFSLRVSREILDSNWRKYGTIRFPYTYISPKNVNMAQEVHRPTIKQQNKAHKTGPHKTKGIIKKQAQGLYALMLYISKILGETVEFDLAASIIAHHVKREIDHFPIKRL